MRVQLPVTRASLALVLSTSLQASAAAQFTEQAAVRGVQYTVDANSNSGSGVALNDLDNDGDLDLVVIGASNGAVGVYENDGTGCFTDRSAGSGISPLPAGSASAIVVADYDGDGLLDLYFSNTDARNQLARGLGNLQWEDVSEAAGVADSGWGSGSTWADYNGEGWLDLYCSNKSTQSNPLPNVLFQNAGDGTFVIDDTSGIFDAELPTWQSVFLDYDADGDADLYVSNDKGVEGTDERNYLWQNTGGNFVDVTEATGTGAYIDSMGVAVGDIDGNGFPELYCTNVGPNPLFMNNGTTFTDVAPEAGVTSDSIGWGALFFDYDLDGRLDLHVCNAADTDRLYEYEGVFPCRDRARPLRLEQPFLSYCTATGDIDNDGDIDLVLSATLEPVNIFINDTPTDFQWSKIRLEGTAPNTKGVGAWVEVNTNFGRQVRQVLAGVGYKSSSPFTLHFGLRRATRINRIEVRWPNGEITVREEQPVNRTLVIRQAPASQTDPVLR